MHFLNKFDIFIKSQSHAGVAQLVLRHLPSGKGREETASKNGKTLLFALPRHLAIKCDKKQWYITCGSGSVGRALPCQGKGRGFEPRLPLHIVGTTKKLSRARHTANRDFLVFPTSPFPPRWARLWTRLALNRCSQIFMNRHSLCLMKI